MTDWPLWLLALIEVLAVHRLTKLVTDDIITIPLRHRVIAWAYLRHGAYDEDVIYGDGSGPNDLDAMVDADMVDDPANTPKLAVLVRCRWCASVWVAGVAVAGHALVPAVWLPLAALLAVSSASTLLAALED